MNGTEVSIIVSCQEKWATSLNCDSFTVNAGDSHGQPNFMKHLRTLASA